MHGSYCFSHSKSNNEYVNRDALTCENSEPSECCLVELISYPCPFCLKLFQSTNNNVQSLTWNLDRVQKHARSCSKKYAHNMLLHLFLKWKVSVITDSSSNIWYSLLVVQSKHSVVVAEERNNWKWWEYFQEMFDTWQRSCNHPKEDHQRLLYPTNDFSSNAKDHLLRVTVQPHVKS